MPGGGDHEDLNVAIAVIKTEFKNLREMELKNISDQISAVKQDLEKCQGHHKEVHEHFYREIDSLKTSRSTLRGAIAILAGLWTLVSAWMISKM